MIPRLPPILLAVLGGASVYGIKYVLDRFEPKAIGPPGSGDHYERVLNYRRNVKRVGIAAVVSTVLYGGYWIYESRMHRSSPAIIERDDKLAFYQDQYQEREKRLSLEREEARRREKEKESLAKVQLNNEIAAMEEVIRRNQK